MSTNLFQSDLVFERLPLEGAEVHLMLGLLSVGRADQVLDELIHTTPWRAEDVLVWGRKYPQPRLIAWYGDPGRAYTYSGIAMNPLPWTPLLLELRAVVENVCSESFNSVLLNYYRNERDSMGMHSDDEPELGHRPTIASLTLGQERIFMFQHKVQRADRPVRLALPSGSLLLMKGDTQRNWKHGIAKSSTPMGPRVNLTFRKIQLVGRRGASGGDSGAA